MEFKRRSRISRVFECDSGEGAYRFVRPSGFSTARKALDFSCPGRDFEVRLEKEKVWLLEGEETIGFGAGKYHRWDLVLSDREFVLDQPKLGVNRSTIENPGGKMVAQVRALGFPISRIELIEGKLFSADEQAFISMLATLGWRESDRSMGGADGAVSGP